MFKTISSSKGWYLFKLALGFESFKDFVFADYASMVKHNLAAGSYIKLERVSRNIYDKDEDNYLGCFKLMPFMNSFKDLFQVLSYAKNSFSGLREDFIDRDCLADLNFSLRSFEMAITDPKGLRLTDVMLTDETELIGINEGLINEFNLSLGDQLILRNDVPLPVIIKAEA